MAAVGTFTAQGDGYTGSIKTLTLNVRNGSKTNAQLGVFPRSGLRR